MVGNGPSRRGRDRDVWRAAAENVLIIGCNAYWRDELPAPDFLVCYDALQVEHALVGTRASETRVVVPEPKCDATTPTIDPDDDHRVFVAAPHQGTAVAVPDSWSPHDFAVGAWSGILAYQLALIAGATTIFLLGIDCAGVRVDGEVHLTALPHGTPGYGPCVVPQTACKVVGGAPMPKPWEQQRELWRVVTQHARAQGIGTYRVTPHGALDWVPVQQPWVP